MERKRKRSQALERLERFRRNVPAVSQSALADILAEGKRTGFPEIHSRKNIHGARELKADQSTPYGRLHADVEVHKADNIGNMVLKIANPLALIWLACAVCTPF